jgi:hypothetical protein
MSKRKPNGYWTKERCKEELLKFSTLKEFTQKNHNLYVIIYDKKWLYLLDTLKREKFHRNEDYKKQYKRKHDRLYYLKNKEKIYKTRKIHRIKIIEKIKQQEKKWRLNNKERYLKSKLKYSRKICNILSDTYIKSLIYNNIKKSFEEKIKLSEISLELIETQRKLIKIQRKIKNHVKQKNSN